MTASGNMGKAPLKVKVVVTVETENGTVIMTDETDAIAMVEHIPKARARMKKMAVEGTERLLDKLVYAAIREA